MSTKTGHVSDVFSNTWMYSNTLNQLGFDRKIYKKNLKSKHLLSINFFAHSLHIL